eukprot:7075137-Pyramimonas_sp.AAC.1
MNVLRTEQLDLSSEFQICSGIELVQYGGVGVGARGREHLKVQRQRWSRGGCVAPRCSGRKSLNRAMRGS